MKYALISQLWQMYGVDWINTFAQQPRSPSKDYTRKQINDEYLNWAVQFYEMVALKGSAAAEVEDRAFAAAVALSHDLEKSVTLTCFALAGMPNPYIAEKCGMECHVVALWRNLFRDPQLIEHRYDLFNRDLIAPEVRAGHQSVAGRMRFACIGGETAAHAIAGVTGFASPDDDRVYAFEEVDELYRRFVEVHSALAALTNCTDDLLENLEIGSAVGELMKLERQREEYRAKIWGRQN